jgi:hypothetical protein
LLESCPEVDEQREWSKTLLHTLISAIEAHPVLELADGREDDKGLIGLLNLVQSMIRRDAELKDIACTLNGNQLLHQLFTTCLFAIPTSENYGASGPPKCKSRASRHAAYKLLNELVKGRCNEFRLLVDMLLAQFTTGMCF